MHENSIDTSNIDLKKIENYLLNYLDELIIHFDLSQNELEMVLLSVYNKIRTPNSIKKLIDMVKLFRR